MKVWAVAMSFNRLPWDKEILDAPVEWLEWTLTMNRLYPDGISFESTEDVTERTLGQKSNVGWANVLRGKARDAFMSRFRPKIAIKTDRITKV